MNASKADRETDATEGPDETEGPDAKEGPDEQNQEEEEEIHEPAKLVRLSRMIQTSLEEIREGGLDERTRTHLGEVVNQIPGELTESLSPDLREELDRLRGGWSTSEHPPSESELRVEQAQLVGWLQGVLGGIQTALSAEQAGTQDQLQQIQGPGGQQPG